MQKRHTGAISVHIVQANFKKRKSVPEHIRACLKMKKNVILGLAQPHLFKQTKEITKSVKGLFQST